MGFMVHDSSYRILMYSHDTYGLGHIRRTMAIAGQLRRPGVDILILTGSPIAGRFDFPEQIDFVRIPGMIKKANDLYLPHTIKIAPDQAMAIRRQIIKATAKAFKPHLFIVDKAPLGLKREIIPTLKWLTQSQGIGPNSGPMCRTVLGLRDVMDDAASTIKDWKSKRIYDALEKYYSEIWVYGHQEMYDPVREYQIPPAIAQRMVFTGYIPRGKYDCAGGECACKEKLVLVTTGGGGDGFQLLDTYLRMLEEAPANFKTVVVSGPFMAKAERQQIARRCRLLGVKFYHFNRRMESLMAPADLVVSMGGYNTVCEILTQRKVALVVPRETPRLEQRIRAEVLKKSGLMDYLGWEELTPDNMRMRVVNLLANPEPYHKAMAEFPLTGLSVLRQRLDHFQNGQNGASQAQAAHAQAKAAHG